MADLARIKSNVAKMAAQNAPEADIDGYIASEGATIDEVRNYRPQAQPSSPNILPAQEAQPANSLSSSLPGPLGQLQNTSAAFQRGATQGMTFGFGDELLAGMMTPIEAGIDAFKGKPFDLGRSYNQALTGSRDDFSNAQRLNPIANAVGEGVGALTTGGALSRGGLSLTSKAALAGKPLAVAGAGALEGGLYGGAYGLGTGDSMQDRLSKAGTGAATGALVGAVAPTVINAAGNAIGAFMNRGAVNAAIKGAPDASDLKAVSSALFNSVDQSGVTVDTPKFAGLVKGLVDTAKKERINPNLDPKASGAFQELIGALDDVQVNGGALTVSDIHTLRQIAQKAATSAEGRDARFANQIVDGLDNFVGQSGNLVIPQNQIGQGGNNAGNELLKAISTWGRARRVGVVEEAIAKAQNQASGVENGLRVQFRALLNNKKTRGMFTGEEIKALEEVANGTPVSNAMRLLGKFGFGGGSASNMLGGTIGFGGGMALGGPVAGTALAVAGTAARKGSEALAGRAANRAAQIVATPGIPISRVIQNPLVPLAAPLGAEQVAGPRRPIEVTVR